MTLSVRADVTGFFPNPPIADESYTYDVNWLVFEGLVRFGPNQDLQPALAERWENPDEQTYLFHLRRGLRFADGRPVTAGDVVASIEAARRRGWVTRDYLQAIDSVRAASPDSVVVRTRFPYLLLLHRLPWGFVLPAEAVTAEKVPAIGTGPYRLESWTPGSGFVLVRNPHFRGPPPPYGRARFVVATEASERVARLVAGEADVADDIPLADADRLARRSDVRVFRGPSLRVLVLGLRADAPPFSDPRVREAVDRAIDRDELIRRAYDGLTVPASQIVPATVVGYNPRIPVTRVDLRRARELLAQAGFSRGFSIRLDGPHNRYVNDRRILHEIARQLAEVGIRVDVNALDKRELFPLVFSGRSRFHLLGFECQSGDAGQALDNILHSPTGGLSGSHNTSGIVDVELDRLIDRTNTSPTITERTATLQEAMARVAALRPVLPLLVQTEAVAVSRRVEWQPGPRFALDPTQMSPAR